MNAVIELRNLGFEVCLENGTIHYRQNRAEMVDHSQLNELLKIIKDNRDQVIQYLKSEENTYGVKLFPSSWVQKYDYETLERLAIMTIDGGLSDQGALEALGIE